MGSGNSGFVTQDMNNYDEPSELTGNRSQTDWAAANKVRENALFKDRRASNGVSVRESNNRARRGQ